jgi:hypothetical protein
MAATVAGQKISQYGVELYTAGSGGTTLGKAVKFSASKTVVLTAAVADLTIGIALETVAAAATAQIALVGSPNIVKALVGTGNATRGTMATYVSDGLTDVTNGAGTTSVFAVGQWLESGVAGELRELNLGVGGPMVKA